MQKKVSRKQLLKEPDEFLTLSTRLLQWIAAYQSRILIGVAVLLVIGIVFSGYQMLNRSWEKEAFTKLNSLKNRYETVKKSDGPAKAYESVQKDFDAFLADASRRTAGKMGLILWGHMCMSAGQTEKAIEIYSRAKEAFEGNPLFAAVAQSALGHAYLNHSDMDKAVAAFEGLIASGGDGAKLVVEDALIQLSAISRQRKDETKSRQYLQQLLKDYPNSMYKEMATGLLNG